MLNGDSLHADIQNCTSSFHRLDVGHVIQVGKTVYDLWWSKQMIMSPR